MEKSLAEAMTSAPSQGFVMMNLQKMEYYANRLRSRPRTEAPLFFWFWGPTGTGKSLNAFRVANLLCPTNYWTLPQRELKWWDGYSQQDCVVIDEFRDTQLALSQLLRLAGPHPMGVEVKGSTTHFNSSVVIITTDRDPRSCFAGEGSIDQLIRRLDLVLYFGPHRAGRLMTSMEPSCKITKEHTSSWTHLDNVGTAVPGTAPSFVPPAPIEPINVLFQRPPETSTDDWGVPQEIVDEFWASERPLSPLASPTQPAQLELSLPLLGTSSSVGSPQERMFTYRVLKHNEARIREKMPLFYEKF